jgi:hypothetical protein
LQVPAVQHVGPIEARLQPAVRLLASAQVHGRRRCPVKSPGLNWITAPGIEANRPIIQPNQQGGAFNPAGVLDGQPTYQGVAGYLFNLPVYLDGSMPRTSAAGQTKLG